MHRINLVLQQFKLFHIFAVVAIFAFFLSFTVSCTEIITIPNTDPPLPPHTVEITVAPHPALTENTYTFPGNTNTILTLSVYKTNVQTTGESTTGFSLDFTPSGVATVVSNTANNYYLRLTNMHPGSLKVTATSSDINPQSGSYTFILKKGIYDIATQGPLLSYRYDVLTNTVNTISNLLPTVTNMDNFYFLANTIRKTDYSFSIEYNLYNFSVSLWSHRPGPASFDRIMYSYNYENITNTVNLFLTSTSSTISSTRMEQIATGGVLPNFSAETDDFVKTTLPFLYADTGATVVPVFFSETGNGNNAGNNWANARSGSDLRAYLNQISDNSKNKVYLIFLADGIYQPSSTNRDASFAFRDYVALMGGFKTVNGVGTWNQEMDTTTFFDGDIGTRGENTDNIKKMFYTVGERPTSSSKSALIYGIIIQNTYGAPQNPHDTSFNGVGMYNQDSAATLVNVSFKNNTGTLGAGIFSRNSNLALHKVVFIDNYAGSGGGAMYIDSSEVSAYDAEFINNKNATTETVSSAFYDNGGAIYITNSTVNISRSKFINNFSPSSGGGIFAINSPYIKVDGGMFWGNQAEVGGGIFLANGTKTFIVNSAFKFNYATSYNGAAVFTRYNSAAHIINSSFSMNSGIDISYYFTLIRSYVINSLIRTGGTVNGVSTGTLLRATTQQNKTYLTMAYSFMNGGSQAVYVLNDPTLTDRTFYQLEATMPKFVTLNEESRSRLLDIPSTSPAIDKGIYVRYDSSANQFYFSSDTRTWYKNITASGLQDAATLPSNTVFLNQNDAFGTSRITRPDLGAHEVR